MSPFLLQTEKNIKKILFGSDSNTDTYCFVEFVPSYLYLLVLFYSTSTNLSAERWRSRPSFKGHVVYMREYYMLLIFQLISDFKKTNRQRVDGCCKKIWAEKKRLTKSLHERNAFKKWVPVPILLRYLIFFLTQIQILIFTSSLSNVSFQTKNNLWQIWVNLKVKFRSVVDTTQTILQPGRTRDRRLPNLRIITTNLIT